MASLTKETRGGKTIYRCEYRDKNKRRRKIRLGQLNKKAAEAVRSRIEALNACSIAGDPMPPALASWVAELGNDLHSKLAAQGLVRPRESAELKPFIDISQ